MLPKIDSPEWSVWGVSQKMDALNEAVQSINECVEGALFKSINCEIKETKNAGGDGKKAKKGSC